MARIHYDVTAQQRYATVPVIDPRTGEPARTRVMSKRTGEQKVTKRGKPVTRARVRADKSRPLPLHTCGYCGKPIEVGTQYKWVSIRSGPYGGRTLRRHQGCPRWRQSELTTSKLSGIYAAQEGFEDFLGTDFDSADEVRDALNTAAEEIRGVAEEYRESAQNIEDGFEHPTSQSEELAEKADELDAWADEIETTGASIDYAPDPEEDYDEDVLTYEEALEEWRDMVRGDVEIVNEIPI